MELALAFHRLGDTKKYLAAIDALLALPLKEAFSYQNRAVDCLIQTHPDRARAACAATSDTPSLFAIHLNTRAADTWAQILSEWRAVPPPTI